MRTTQGYVTLATGDPKYLEMAANLAASIKVMDPRRRVCLVHDFGEAFDPTLAAFFDDLVPISRDARYPHVMNKIRLFQASPYDQTMFVDADCLLMKHDVDRYWTYAAQHFFCITGTPKRRGEWKGVMVDEILRARGLDYMISMNAGVFYFDRSEASRRFFEEFDAFYLAEIDNLSISNYKGKGSQSFELYLGIFLGMKDMKHVLMPNFNSNSWMVSTWRTAFCRFDIRTGLSEIYKLNDFLFGLPLLPTRMVRLSPTFPHFVGLKPKRTYARLAAEFRRLCRSGRQAGAAVS